MVHAGNLWEWGRYVAFDSTASNLVPGDTNFRKDIFIHDRLLRITTRASVNSLGVESNAPSFLTTISGNGRFVAMESTATNLVSNDTNGTPDVFVHDRATGRIIRASVDSSGLEGNESSGRPWVSADSSWAAFQSSASNLVRTDNNGVQDTFLHQTSTGITTRVSVSSVGGEAQYPSEYPSISPDGRLVGFKSGSYDLVPNDQNGHEDIFIHDHLGPTLTKEGLCPGGITLLVSGGTPSQTVAMFFGPAGSFVQATPPCQGVGLSIGQPQFGGIATTNALGVTPFPFVAPPGACGLRMQAVSITTCTPTNVMAL